jgi:hypothetical protein
MTCDEQCREPEHAISRFFHGSRTGACSVTAAVLAHRRSDPIALVLSPLQRTVLILVLDRLVGTAIPDTLDRPHLLIPQAVNPIPIRSYPSQTRIEAVHRPGLNGTIDRHSNRVRVPSCRTEYEYEYERAARTSRCTKSLGRPR